MLLLDGQTGEYAYSLPMVVTILLLSSWFLSMYMTPFTSFWFLKVRPRQSTGTTEGDGDAYSGGIYKT
jgi:multidrug efflux pump subunit AcrB